MKPAQLPLAMIILPLTVYTNSDNTLTLDISENRGQIRGSNKVAYSAFIEIYNHRNTQNNELIFRLRKQLSLNCYLENVGVIGDFEGLTIKIIKGCFFNDFNQAAFTAEPRLQIRTSETLEDRIFPGFTLAECDKEITPEKEFERLAKYMGRHLMAQFRHKNFDERVTLADLWDMIEEYRCADLLKTYLGIFRKTARNLSLKYPVESYYEKRIRSYSKQIDYSLRKMIKLAERIKKGEFDG